MATGRIVVRPGQLDQWAARLALHVGRVDHGKLATGQPLARDEVKDLEGRLRSALVVLVVADQCPACIRGEHLGRPEVPGGERRLARSGRTHEDDQ
jgi:hypothetical protein